MESLPSQEQQQEQDQAKPPFTWSLASGGWNADGPMIGDTLAGDFDLDRWLNETRNEVPDVSTSLNARSHLGGDSGRVAGWFDDLEVYSSSNIDDVAALRPWYERDANDFDVQPLPAPVASSESTFVHDNPKRSQSIASNTPSHRRHGHNKKDMHKIEKKRQPRISPSAKLILTKFYSHTPYPSASDYAKISVDAGIAETRVRNWFTNTRTRRPESDRPILSKRSLEKLTQELVEVPRTDDASMETWLTAQSGPTDFNSVPTGPQETIPWLSGSVTCSSPPSIYSSVGTSSSVGSHASWGSTHSRLSIGSNASSHRGRRRGRKRSDHENLPGHNCHEDREIYQSRPFMCTFCDADFKTQFDWKRHEESTHVPQQIWICCPLPSLMTWCPFCPQFVPDVDHLNEHNYLTCHNRAEKDRTFYRKDQFIQHIHAIHFENKDHSQEHPQCSPYGGDEFGCDYIVSSWNYNTSLARTNPALHCGFCGEWCSTWKDRQRHVSEHFKHDGRTSMSSWWPERKSGSELKGIRCWSCRYLPDINHLMEDMYRIDSASLAVIFTDQYVDTYRSCAQPYIFSFPEFLFHLISVHGVPASITSPHANQARNKILSINYINDSTDLIQESGQKADNQTTDTNGSNPSMEGAPLPSTRSSNYVNSHPQENGVFGHDGYGPATSV